MNRLNQRFPKSFKEFATPMVSKITALTVIPLINKRNGNNINDLKIALPKLTTGMFIAGFITQLWKGLPARRCFQISMRFIRSILLVFDTYNRELK